MRLDRFDVVKVDDRRAVDPLETARIEAFFKVLHRLAQDQRLRGGVDAHIIARRVDPFDIVDVDAENLAAILDVDDLFKAVRRRVAGVGQVIGERIGGDVGEDILQPPALLAAALLVEAGADPVDRRRQPIGVDGFHQIVDGVRLERLDRVFHVRRDEHDERRLDLGQPGDHRKPIEPRHLDIEKDEIGLERLDRPDRLATVDAALDDLDIGKCLQPQLEALDRQTFVVDKNGPDHSALSRTGISAPALRSIRSLPTAAVSSSVLPSDVWYGMSISTISPRGSLGSSSNR